MEEAPGVETLYGTNREMGRLVEQRDGGEKDKKHINLIRKGAKLCAGYKSVANAGVERPQFKRHNSSYLCCAGTVEIQAEMMILKTDYVRFFPA